ncbi:hypothetical protein ACFV2H_15715 [Streptomyces sp. NPDC059629]|uniref:hypothetical protein n=1 Tax=Streptomyces sp. NPDC059629 TaxID=3346889 RepID=UPI0036D05003
MKSERPENDDASAGTAGEPPEAQETTETAGPGTRADAESTEGAVAEGAVAEAAPEPKATEPEKPSEPSRARRPKASPEPERAPAAAETPEPEKAPAAESTPEPPAAPAAEAAPESAAAPEPEKTSAAEGSPELPKALAAEETPAAEADPEPVTAPEPEKAPFSDAAPEPEDAPSAQAAPEPAAVAVPEADQEQTVAVPAAGADSELAVEAVSPAAAEAEPEVVASPVGAADVSGAPGAAGVGRPVRRRSSALVIASVAAAVLLVGGGGAILAGRDGSGGGTGAGASGGSTPPPLALDGYSSGTGSSTGNGIAPGEPNPYGVTYKASGTLPDGPGSAAVYQPSGAVSEDRVAGLAKALGIEGTPVAEGQVWKVGTDNDGSGGSLQVNRTGTGIWTYSRYAPGTDTCKSGLVCAQDPIAPAGDPVSVSAAEKAAAPVLKALGQDDAKLDASQVMGAQRVVNAAPVVGGLPTYGWSTGLTVDKQGEVVGGNGMLAAPAKGDTYPVLSAAKTLALLNAAPGIGHRMGIGGCASSVPLKDRLEQPCTASTPSASSAVIEKAVFGLAARSVAGRQALVPSWLFQVRGAANAYTVTYPAVDPKYLASASSPTPSASASVAPKDVKVDGYTVDGRDLTVAFTGGVCADYKATADESSEQVLVKVTATPWPDKICVMIAKQYHQTIHLDAPLDGRKVVGTDGKAVAKEKATTLDPQAKVG